MPELQHQSAFSVVSCRSRFLASLYPRPTGLTQDIYQNTGVLLQNCHSHCTLNYLVQFERCGTQFCLSFKQNICDHFAPIFPCLQKCLSVCAYSSHIMFTPVAALQHFFRFTGEAEPCLPPEISEGRQPLPPPHRVPNLFEVIKHYIHCLYCTMWCSNNYTNILFQWHHVLQSDVADFVPLQCYWIHVADLGPSTCSWVYVQCTLIMDEYSYECNYTAKS